MSRKKEVVRVSLLLVIILSGFVLAKPVKVESETEYFFRLKAITDSGETGIRPDILFFLKQHCARIGIHIDVYTYDWPTYLGELVKNGLFNYDICYVSFIGGHGDPDFTGVYNENGSLNLFGYKTTMDWDEDLGTGINEWYLQTGRTMWPPDSEERIQHYWDWQDYMMREILPVQPTFVPKAQLAAWSNLQGYNYEEGLFVSWGNMSWDGLHTGQNSINEVIVQGNDWQTLNPLFSGSQSEVYNKILDPVYMTDYDLNFYPHLATEIIVQNDTHIRLKIREDVKWHEDSDGFFPSEYVDVDDFYFSYYAMKNFFEGKQFYFWIEDLRKVDQYTLDIFIDGNPSTPENEPFAPFNRYMPIYILPEHYLNQSQLPDGVTPDIHHSSWNKFATDGFGTSLFSLESHVESVQTILSIVPDCWLLDPLVDKTDMDFEQRFGDFSGGLTTLRSRVIPSHITQMTEFELGKIDMVSLGSQLDKRDEYLLDPNFDIHSKFLYSYSFFGYNMRENRPHIGNRTACPGDPDMTIGLAVRKAISYALDRHEINEVLYNGEMKVSDFPIYEEQSTWCNPNIVRYNHDLAEARKLMAKAGYEELPPGRLNGWEIAGMVLVSVFIAGVIIFTYYKTGKK